MSKTLTAFQEQAVQKLDTEIKSFKGEAKAKTVSKPLHRALLDFCKQEPEFAQAVVQSGKTLSDCAMAVMANVGNSISDLEVYRRAAAFYFPGAGIRMTMTVDLCASVSGDGDGAAGTEKGGLLLDLSDFL